jgi:FkbM family methyltransferase
MERLVRLATAAGRVLLRALSTDRCRLSWPEKLVRGAALVPVFGAMLVLLRLWAVVRGPLVVDAVTRERVRFRCRLPDMIQTYLYLFGVWEPDVSAFIAGRLKPGDTFVDVGANIGYHTLLAAHRLGREGRVVAIESSPKIYRLLQESLADNGSPGVVRTVNRAASDAVGELALYEGPAQNIGLSTTVATRGLPSEGTISAAPLADLLEPEEISTARLVKIDVEGAEVAVLRGMKEFLDRCSRDVEVIVELSPQ